MVCLWFHGFTIIDLVFRDTLDLGVRHLLSLMVIQDFIDSSQIFANRTLYCIIHSSTKVYSKLREKFLAVNIKNLQLLPSIKIKQKYFQIYDFISQEKSPTQAQSNLIEHLFAISAVNCFNESDHFQRKIYKFRTKGQILVHLN